MLIVIFQSTVGLINLQHSVKVQNMICNVCCICYETKGVLIDPHFGKGSDLESGKHLFHATCLTKWLNLSKKRRRHICPYCSDKLRPDFEEILQFEICKIHVSMCEMIRRNDLGSFKEAMEAMSQMDEDTLLTLSIHATIMNRINFLDVIEKAHKIPLSGLNILLAISLSMKSTALKKWYRGMLSRALYFDSKFRSWKSFQNRLLIASLLIGSKRLYWYYKFKLLFVGVDATFSNIRDLKLAAKFGIDKIASLVVKSSYVSIKDKDFISMVVPSIASSVKKGQVSKWILYFARKFKGEKALQVLLSESIKSRNYEGCYQAVIGMGNDQKKTITYSYMDICHLIGPRGRLEGKMIIELLHQQNMLNIHNVFPHGPDPQKQTLDSVLRANIKNVGIEIKN